MKPTIVIATHKEYPMPEDPLYLPLHAGKANARVTLPYQGDNTGEHISEKNPHYCELTVLYWAWKNLDADYIGLAHYRRHFALHKPFFRKHNIFSHILNSTELEHLLQHYDILLPKPRNYFIETNYSHYIHAHPAESMEKTKAILFRCFPEYKDAFETVMKRTRAHRFNMLIMKKEMVHDYCHWLFTILFELENSLDISGYDDYNQRIFGFISERLLDVYLEKNQLPYKELPVLFLEKEHWIKKGAAFLKRKFLHR
ncbi:MAG: DUF4422 domain-containing protein [Lachnospiraceae bacterium]|nr:DUF4422 domain-containing protein [Lachnospiraceae bacterium]